MPYLTPYYLRLKQEEGWEGGENIGLSVEYFFYAITTTSQANPLFLSSNYSFRVRNLPLVELPPPIVKRAFDRSIRGASSTA